MKTSYQDSVDHFVKEGLLRRYERELATARTEEGKLLALNRYAGGLLFYGMRKHLSTMKDSPTEST